MVNDARITGNDAPMPVDPNILLAVSEARYYNPHDVLGPHADNNTQPTAGLVPAGLTDVRRTVTIRTLKPMATTVEIITRRAHHRMHHECNGIFTTVVDANEVETTGSMPDYRIATTYADGITHVEDDPYRYPPAVGQLDIYLFGQGRHERLWNMLGARVQRHDDPLGDEAGRLGRRVTGTEFTLWAPNAQAVRVVGAFNSWDGRRHAMRSLGSSGVWELFVPAVRAGSLYKFEILNAQGNWVFKADPMERFHEVSPGTASIVFESTYQWHDDDWMDQRERIDAHANAMSIYEVHAGSWKQGLTNYRDLADDLVDYVHQEGFTHVEFMPLAQYPFYGSWGYQVTGYYAVDSRMGSPDDFKYLVNRFHEAGIGVIVDWVPAHFPKDDFALGRFDGTALYEDPDPKRGEQPDWGTYVFNYGRREVRNFLVANACFWLSQYHVDGLRVDAVSSMLYLDYSRNPGEWKPNVYGGRENLEAISFLQEANATAYKNNPGIVMIAEESTAYPGVTAMTDLGGLGFGLKWNMGWMHDTLAYLHEDPVNRHWHHNEITFSMIYAYSEHFILAISHDEVVYGKGSLFGKMSGDDWKRYAGVRCLFAYQWAHPGRKLTFMGNEIAQYGEWDHRHSVDWAALQWREHREIQQFVADLNALYRSHAALWDQDFDPAGFQWLTDDDANHNTLVFARYGSHGEQMVVVVNFSGCAWHNYRIPLTSSGKWHEVLTTDDARYGGSGITNGSFDAQQVPMHGKEWSINITVPALGAVFLEPVN